MPKIRENEKWFEMRFGKTCAVVVVTVIAMAVVGSVIVVVVGKRRKTGTMEGREKEKKGEGE